jgi:hypothetical protein
MAEQKRTMTEAQLADFLRRNGVALVRTNPPAEPPPPPYAQRPLITRVPQHRGILRG